MSASGPEFRPSDDEIAVRHPALRSMVDAARRQPMPRVEVSAEAIHEEWNRRRSRWRWGVGVGSMAAASLVLVLAYPWSSGSGPADDVVVSHTPHAPADASVAPSAGADRDLSLIHI